jgi:histidinol-phosphate aminotransferase
MSPERIEELASAAKRAVFVLDEAYVDYTHAGSLRELRSRLPNVAILRTLSKVGLAALRIGWLEADEAIAQALDKARQPFNVSATSQAAATAALDEAWPAVQAHVASIVGERHRVATEIARMPGLTVTPSEANFVWVKTTRPGSDVQTALIERGVLVRSFHKIGGRMAQQLRVTIGTPSDNDALLDALRASCA